MREGGERGERCTTRAGAGRSNIAGRRVRSPLAGKIKKNRYWCAANFAPFIYTDNFPHSIARGGGNPQTPMAMLRPRARGVFGGGHNKHNARTHTFTH